MPENEIYKFLKENNLTSKDEASFTKEYSDPKKAQELHKFMSENDLTTKDSATFYETYFDPSKKKVQDTPTTSNGLENSSTQELGSSGKTKTVEEFNAKYGTNYTDLKTGQTKVDNAEKGVLVPFSPIKVKQPSGEKDFIAPKVQLPDLTKAPMKRYEKAYDGITGRIDNNTKEFDKVTAEAEKQGKELEGTVNKYNNELKQASTVIQNELKAKYEGLLKAGSISVEDANLKLQEEYKKGYGIAEKQITSKYKPSLDSYTSLLDKRKTLGNSINGDIERAKLLSNSVGIIERNSYKQTVSEYSNLSDLMNSSTAFLGSAMAGSLPFFLRFTNNNLSEFAAKNNMPELSKVALEKQTDLEKSELLQKMEAYAKEEAQRGAYFSNKITEKEGTLVDNFSQGNYAQAGKVAGLRFLESIPMMGAAIGMTALTGGTASAIIPGGFMFGSQNYYGEYADRPDMSETDKLNASFVKGSLEMITELSVMPLLSPLKGLIKTGGKEAVREAVEKTLFNSMKEGYGKLVPYFGWVQEGLSEYTNEVGSTITDKILDPKFQDKDWGEVIKEANVRGLEAFGPGAFGGVTLTLPVAINNTINKYQNKKMAREFASELEKIEVDIQNPNLTEAQKDILIARKQEIHGKLNEVFDADKQETAGATTEQISALDDINDQQDEVAVALQDETISDESKVAFEEKAKELAEQEKAVLEEIKANETANQADLETRKNALKELMALTGVSIYEDAVHDGSFNGEGFLDMDTDGNVILTRYADSEDNLTKGGQVTSPEVLKRDANNHTYNAVSTSAVEGGMESYRREGGVIGKYKIPFKELAKLMKEGSVYFAGIGNKEFVLSPHIAEQYLSSIDGKEINKTNEKEPNTADNEPSNDVVEPIVEPTEEQIAKDIKDKNFVTFEYKSESEVPEQFKDKISSVGEVNGIKIVKVTLPKVVADYELAKINQLSPTTEKPKGENDEKPTTKKTKTDESPVNEIKNGTNKEQIADLRAKEQAEYDAMSNPKDKVERQKIYDKYDKLITPLLEKEKEQKERTRKIELLDTEKKIAQIEKEIRKAPIRGSKGQLSQRQLRIQLQNLNEQLRDLKGLPPKKKVTDSVLRITKRNFSNEIKEESLSLDERLIFSAIGSLSANDKDIVSSDANKQLRKQGALVKQGGLTIDQIVTDFINENDLDADMAQDFRNTLIDFVNGGDAYAWMNKIKEREAQLDPDAIRENEFYNYVYDAAIENDLTDEEISEIEEELLKYNDLTQEEYENIRNQFAESDNGTEEGVSGPENKTDTSKEKDQARKSALEAKVKEAKNAYDAVARKLTRAKQAAEKAGQEQQANIFGGKPADALLFGTDLRSLNVKVKERQAEADKAKESLDKAQLALDSFVPSNQVQLEVEAPSETDLIKDENGKPIVFYHGTNKQFSEFTPSSKEYEWKGIFFAYDRSYAEWRNKDRIIEANIEAKKPLDVTNDEVYDNLSQEVKNAIKQQDIPYLKSLGYDAVILKKPLGKEIVVFDSSQVKEIGNTDAELIELKKQLKAAKLTSDKKIIQEKIDILLEKQPKSKQSRFVPQASEGVKQKQQSIIEKLKQAFPNIEIVQDEAQLNEVLAKSGARQMNNNGVVYGAIYNGKIYLNPTAIRLDTPIHEFGHIWLDIAKNKYAEYYQNLINTIKATPYFEEAKLAYPDLTETQQAEEAVVQAIAEKGIEQLEAQDKKGVLRKVFDTIKAMGKAILKGLGIKNDMNFLKATWQDLVNKAAQDILSGKPITYATSEDIANMDIDAYPISIEGGLLDTRRSGVDRFVSSISGRKYSGLIPYLTEMFKVGGSHKEIRNLDYKRIGEISAFFKQIEGVAFEFKTKMKAWSKGKTDAEINKAIQAMQVALTKSVDALVMKNVPKELVPIIIRMRSDVDGLSQLILDSGFIDPNTELFASISANLGIYMNRSYAAFANEKWNQMMFPDSKKRTPLMEKIYKDAYNYIRDQYDNFVEVDNELYILTTDGNGNITGVVDSMENPVDLSQTELLTKIQKAYNNKDKLTVDEIEKILMEFARFNKDEFKGQGGKIGKMDLSLFKKRQDIAEPLRAFLGEYTEPQAMYINTMTKMAAYIEDQKFLNEVKKLGEGKIFFTQKTGDYDVEIGSGKAYSPLNTMFTSPEIAEFLKGRNYEIITFPKFFWTISGGIKFGYTALSIKSQERNFLSNVFINFINGYYNPFVRDNKQYEGAYKLAAKELGHKGGNGLAILAKYNVLETSVIGEDLKNIVQHMFGPEAQMEFGDKDNNYKKFMDRFKNISKATLNKSADVYKFGDNIHKIFAFYSEVANVRFMFPEKTEDQQYAIAADRFKATNINYGMTPEIVKYLRANPFISAFPTFAAEAMRISVNIPVIAIKDIKDGIKNKNKAQQMVGINRLSSFTLGMSLSIAIPYFIAKSVGGDDDDERLIEASSPDYAKNTNKVIIGKKGVKYDVIDLSWQNPLSFYQVAYITFKNKLEETGSYLQSFAASMLSILKPFVSAEIITNTLYSIYKNDNGTGFPIYNEQDSWWNKTKDISEYIYREVRPGIVKETENVYKGAIGAEEFGRKYELSSELKQLATGTKVYKVDGLKKLGQLSYKYADLFDKDYQLYRTELSKYTGNVSDKAKLEEQYNNANKKFKENQLEILKYINILRKKGVSDEDIFDKIQNIGGPYNRKLAQYLIAGVTQDLKEQDEDAKKAEKDLENSK